MREEKSRARSQKHATTKTRRIRQSLVQTVFEMRKKNRKKEGRKKERKKKGRKKERNRKGRKKEGRRKGKKKKRKKERFIKFSKEKVFCFAPGSLEQRN